MNEDDRIAKKQKLDNGSGVKSRSRRHIFAPYRTIGLVASTPVPFTSVALGKTTFQITTSVGHSLQTFDLRKGLHLVFITRPQAPEIITASAAWKDKVLAAWHGELGRGVWVFQRGKKIGELEVPKDLDEAVTSFCIFGTWIIGLCQSRALVWKADNSELYMELRGISPVPFASAAITALPTLLNKVIIGRQDGSAEIWNVSSGKLIYTIIPPSIAYGAVTAIVPAPAVGLAAIAYANGMVIIHDVQADQPVLAINAGEGTPVTSISFRTDGIGAGDDGQKSGAMATASTASGDITFWDLNNGGRRAGVLRPAHLHPSSAVVGGVSKLEFLPGQAILVSSGLDNSLKTWIFDETPFSAVPRILHQRSGHGADITKLQFLPTASDGSDDMGKWLMSGSQDRSLWAWSLRRDAQSAELSQGAVQSKARKQGLLAAGAQDAYHNLRCPPVRAMACSMNRDGGIGAMPGKQPIWQNAKGQKGDAETSAMTGWESVVTAHHGDSKARTWFWGRRRAGRWAFPSADGGNVSAVAMSPCGTFALVGSEQGSIDMYNLQSGQHRQYFPARLTPMQAKQFRIDISKTKLTEEIQGKKTFLRGQGRHQAAVVGLAVDEMNKTVVSADAAGKVKFWDFRTGLLEHELDWSVSARALDLRLHRGAGLVIVTCSDFCIRVVDIETRRVVRELRVSYEITKTGQALTNCIISSDARWIIASVGAIVLSWDLSTGHLIDAMKLRHHCTSLDMSATGEYLATAIEGSVGVEIWTNKSLFTYTPTRQLSQDDLADIIAGDAVAATVSGEGDNAELEGTDDESEDDITLDDTVSDLTADMLSLSFVPRSRWQNLINLDLLRQRNQPTEAPKKPEKAPFFLSATLNGLKSVAPPTDTTTAETDKQRLVRKLDTRGSTFTQLLQSSAQSNDFAPFLDHLKELNPPAADIEIRSLSAMNDEFEAFIHALTWLAQHKKDFELGQAWMAVFLRVHGDIVRNDPKLREAIGEWRTESSRESQRVRKVAEYCGGLVGYLRAARV